MIKAPERYRVTTGLMKTDSSYGNNGCFTIQHYKIYDYKIHCIISDGGGWEHVSVALSATKRNVDRCPTWEEMCFVKNLFWSEDEYVLQFHAPKDEHINNHKYCLHLWKPIGVDIKLPNSMMVGLKSHNL